LTDLFLSNAGKLLTELPWARLNGLSLDKCEKETKQTHKSEILFQKLKETRRSSVFEQM